MNSLIYSARHTVVMLETSINLIGVESFDVPQSLSKSDRGKQTGGVVRSSVHTKAVVKSNATTGYVGAVRPYRPCKIRYSAQPLIVSL